jgi:hypothetical protein
MPTEGIETTIPASERPQTHVLDRTATGISSSIPLVLHKLQYFELLVNEDVGTVKCRHEIYVRRLVLCYFLIFTEKHQHGG